jgi:hypothetical protein
MNDNQRKYSVVVLFNASERNEKGEFEEIIYKKNRAIYLGGQTRMNAAREIAPEVDTYILVGGSKKKVNDMKSFLEESFRKGGLSRYPRLVRVQSEETSLGNLWAVKKIFNKIKGKDFLKNRTIYLMTNEYHIPRVSRLTADIFAGLHITFIPIVAEEILFNHESDSAAYKSALNERLIDESKGIEDWESGVYINQFNKEEFWPSVCYDEDIFRFIS